MGSVNRPNRLLKLMQEKGLTLSLAESVTCGMASNMLASHPGTSDVLKGAIICYAPEVKTTILKIPASLINKWSAESVQVTERLAKNLRKIIPASVCAAVTGLASEGGSETKAKPVGTIFISVLYRNKLHSEKKYFRGTPLEIREKASHALFDLINKILRQ